MTTEVKLVPAGASGRARKTCKPIALEKLAASYGRTGAAERLGVTTNVVSRALDEGGVWVPYELAAERLLDIDGKQTDRPSSKLMILKLTADEAEFVQPMLKRLGVRVAFIETLGD